MVTADTVDGNLRQSWAIRPEPCSVADIMLNKCTDSMYFINELMIGYLKNILDF